jgi:hypothetical protein
LSLEEMGEMLRILAKEYQTTIPVILEKLDKVSGNLGLLHKVMNGERTLQWTEAEDEMLGTRPEFIEKLKGKENCQLRKKYLDNKGE